MPNMTITIAEQLSTIAGETTMTLQELVSTMKASGMDNGAIKNVLLNDLKTGGRIFGNYRNQIKNTVKTGVGISAGNSSRATFTKAGIKQFRWQSVGDTKVCADCEPRQGQVDSLEFWQTVGLPQSGFSICRYNCRCQLIPANYTAKGLDKPLLRKKKKPIPVKKAVPVKKPTPKPKQVKKKKLTQLEKNTRARNKSLDDAIKTARLDDIAYNKSIADSPYDVTKANQAERLKHSKTFLDNYQKNPELAKKAYYKIYTDPDFASDTLEDMYDNMIWSINEAITGGSDIGRQNFLLKQYLKDEGMWEKPKSVTNKEFNKILRTEGNGDVYYRGINVDKKSAESYFKSKDTYSGKGYYGDGIYCANPRTKGGESIATANGYARGTPEQLGNPNGWIVKFTMQNGSKTANFTDVEAMLKAERNSLVGNIVKDKGLSSGEFFRMGEYLNPKYGGKYNHLQDVGSYAVHKKIDLIHVNKSLDGVYGEELGYSVVLNRSKMICVDKAGKVKGSREKMEWIYGD
tara:strand:- start:2474 stop:4024 length:1551 start_codon:yes stop_codon:yes gene_type:complete